MESGGSPSSLLAAGVTVSPSGWEGALVHATTATAAVDSLLVLLIEDQQTFADSLSVALRNGGAIDRVLVAGTAARAAQLAALEHPDVVILDLVLPDAAGMGLCRTLRRDLPDARLIVLTADPRPEDVALAAELGVSAFLTKCVGLDTLVAAVHDRSGRTFAVDPSLLLEVARAKRPDSSGSRLTARERQVLGLLSEGFDVRSLAHELNVSPHTARDYIKVIYRKLDVHSQLEAVLTAFRSGELELRT